MGSKGTDRNSLRRCAMLQTLYCGEGFSPWAAAASQAGRHEFDPRRPLHTFPKKFRYLRDIRKGRARIARWLSPMYHPKPAKKEASGRRLEAGSVGLGGIAPTLFDRHVVRLLAFSPLNGKAKGGRFLSISVISREQMHGVPQTARRACSARVPHIPGSFEEEASYIGANAQFKRGRASWTLRPRH